MTHSSDGDPLVGSIQDLPKVMAARLDFWHDFQGDLEELAHLRQQHRKQAEPQGGRERDKGLLLDCFALHKLPAAYVLTPAQVLDVVQKGARRVRHIRQVFASQIEQDP